MNKLIKQRVISVRVTASTLFLMKPAEVIENVSKSVFETIPEEIDMTELANIERSLARLSNNYAYVVELTGYSRNFVRQLKRQGNKERYEDMMDIRDSLEYIASAVKLQYQSVSRILTVKQQTLNYADMHEYRKGARYDDN